VCEFVLYSALITITMTILIIIFAVEQSTHSHTYTHTHRCTYTESKCILCMYVCYRFGYTTNNNANKKNN